MHTQSITMITIILYSLLLLVLLYHSVVTTTRHAIWLTTSCKQNTLISYLFWCIICLCLDDNESFEIQIVQSRENPALLVTDINEPRMIYERKEARDTHSCRPCVTTHIWLWLYPSSKNFPSLTVEATKTRKTNWNHLTNNMSMISRKVLLVLSITVASAVAAPECSANAACSGLAGDCCPTTSGAYCECG